MEAFWITDNFHMLVVFQCLTSLTLLLFKAKKIIDMCVTEWLCCSRNYFRG